MRPEPRLFYGPWSHYCVSAERMLAFKRLAVQRTLVPYHDKRELLRASGQDYIPALTWEGRTIPWEEIPDFLEEQVPEPTLYPDGTRGVAQLLENWGHQVLEERVWRYVVTRVAPTFEDEQERWVFEEMQTRSRGSFAVLDARREEFRADLYAHLAMLEAALASRDWLLDRPSLADFGVFGGLAPLVLVERQLPDEFPKLSAWWKRVEQLHA
jgi:glutathione S-transferase